MSVALAFGAIGERGERTRPEWLSHAVATAEHGLRQFIRQQIDDIEETEDLLQDVYYQLVLNYDPAQPIANLTGWLYRVARNKIIDLYRRRSSRGVHLDLDHATSQTSERDNADADFEQQAMWEAMNEALEALSDEQREVFILNELEGISFKEISAKLGVPVNTLLSRKHAAVQKLRASLAELYEEYTSD